MLKLQEVHLKEVKEKLEDAYLTKIMSEKRLTLINAWDEYEKARAENRAAKNLSFITSWEHAKEAELEAGLKKMEEQLEKKKALYKEKLKKKAAALHKSVEKMIAKVEAERGGKIVLVEERAAKYRAKTEAQMKFFGILEA
ncbi:unnamed protein product [Alopecurus aequalis]